MYYVVYIPDMSELWMMTKLRDLAMICDTETQTLASSSLSYTGTISSINLKTAPFKSYGVNPLKRDLMRFDVLEPP